MTPFPLPPRSPLPHVQARPFSNHIKEIPPQASGGYIHCKIPENTPPDECRQERHRRCCGSRLRERLGRATGHTDEPRGNKAAPSRNAASKYKAACVADDHPQPLSSYAQKRKQVALQDPQSHALNVGRPNTRWTLAGRGVDASDPGAGRGTGENWERVQRSC